MSIDKKDGVAWDPFFKVVFENLLEIRSCIVVRGVYIN